MFTVISYQNPDLDGTACAIAYAELLNKQGKQAQAGAIGRPHREAEFALNKLNVKFPEITISAKDDIILVDASDLKALPVGVSSSQVVEVIDHRKVHEANKFPNAKVQIELVGAAATLIAERFFKENIIPSKEAASLLYLAIVSNTVNFKTNNTTSRDRKIAVWLTEISKLDEKIVHEMFAHKSKIESVYTALDDDFATFDLKEKVGIAQLEIINAEKFVNERKTEIETGLAKLKKDEGCALVFLTCVDLETAENFFVVIDNQTKELLTNSINAIFKENIGKRKGILMRKEIVPLIKEALS